MSSSHPTFSPEELATEIWKAIPDWPDHYRVSNLGRVRSSFLCNSHPRPTILKGGYVLGYHKVTLYRDVGGTHEKKLVSVHRLVLAAFIGPRPSNQENGVNHLDANRANNRLTNLEYANHKENMAHGVRLGLFPGPGHSYERQVRGSRQGSAKLTEEDVYAMRCEHVLDGKSGRELARKYGLGQSQVSRILRGEDWKHVPSPNPKPMDIKSFKRRGFPIPRSKPRSPRRKSPSRRS